jgi:chromosome segregation ATPase
MSPKTNPVPFAIKICLLLSVLTLCAACTAMVGKGEPADTNHFFAEYSMMRKRLPLIERENDVLKQENRQYRADNLDKRGKIEKLSQQLTTANDSYAKYKAAAENQFQSLREDMENLKMENAAKIETMAATNKAVKESLNRRIQKLGKQIETQKAAFGEERKQLVQQNAQSELKLTRRINDLNKTIEGKVTEISSLRIALSEISTRLGEVTARAVALRKARDEYVTELAAMKDTNAGLHKKVDAAKVTNSQLQKKIDEAKATVVQLQNKIDTVNAANAQLRKKIDTVSSTNTQLQKKIDTVSTTNAQLQNKNVSANETIAEMQKKIDAKKAAGIEPQK